MFKLLMFIVGLVGILVGCDKKPSEEIGYGKIENGQYSNHYFGMSIDVPNAWSVQSQAQQKQLMETGKSMLAGEDGTLKAILTETDKQTINLFSFFQYEQGSPVPFNPSIMALAERVVHAPGIKSGSDYLFHVRKLLEAGQIKYEFTDEVRNVDISGVEFDLLHMTIPMADINVEQKYYAAKINDYVLSFILSFSTTDEEIQLQKILDSISFK